MPEAWFYDDTLTDLRWQWVDAVRAYGQHSPPPARAVRRAQAAASAYFARVEGLRRAQ